MKSISNQNSFITGPAGTGKSYKLNQIFQKTDKKTTKLALTGVAALNIEGATIHSFLGTGTQTNREYLKTLKTTRSWSYIKSRVKSVDEILLDEISMCRRDFFELSDAIMKEATGNKEPFGGKKVTLFGDFLQLPPVVKSDEILPRPWPFQSKVWEEADFEIKQLKKIYRQDDPEFIDALQLIRLGKCPKAIDKMMKSRVGAKLKTKLKPVRFMATNKQVNFVNSKNLRRLPGEPVTFEAEVYGKNQILKEQLISDCVAPEKLVLKRRAQVMVLVNSTGYKRYVNGSMGRVVDFSDEGYPIVRIDKTKEKVTFEPCKWEKLDYEGNVLASFKQIPLRLAYAVTIHKSQGLTLDYASIDCEGIFSPGQVYVALSRVRSLDGLKLKNWDKDLIQADEDALRFYKNGCVWED